jgi:hypothetical protein
MKIFGGFWREGIAVDELLKRAETKSVKIPSTI